MGKHAPTPLAAVSESFVPPRPGLKQRVLTASLALALAIPAPAAAQPPAQSAAQRPPAAAPSRPALVAESSRLRHAFAVDPAGTLASLPEPEARVLRSALGSPDVLAIGRWGDVVAASTQFFDVRLVEADTFWWNPLIDAGIAIRWGWDGSVWRIAAAAPFTGAALRGSGGRSVPPLEGRALRRISAETRAAAKQGGAERLYIGGSQAEAVLTRAREASQALLAAGGGERLAVERVQAGRALFAARAPGGAGGPGLAAALATLDTRQRRGLAPRTQAAWGGGIAVAWSSAGVPDTLFILHYPTAGDVRPRSVEVVPIIVLLGEEP